MPRAQIHLNIGGKKRFLKFTLYSLLRFDKDKGEDGAAFRYILESQMTAVLSITKYALDYPGNENQLPEDFGEALLADWIDDLPQKDLQMLVETMMKGIKKYGDAFTGSPEESVQSPKS